MPEPNDNAHTSRVLSGVSYFSGLEKTILDDIARQTTRQDYQPDETVFWEGDVCRGLYVLESGWLKVYKLAPNGREQVLHFLGPGESFNALSVFTGTPNPATVVALEPAVVWLVEREIMLKLLERHPAMARLVIQDLAERLLHMLSLVEDISLRTVESRLARFLLERSGDQKITRRRWATQAEIAARLGTVPDVLNRVLRKLTEEGLIEVARHQITILDPAGLERKTDSGQ